MSSSDSQPARLIRFARAPDVGRAVLTPTGRRALIVAVHIERREATVQWPDSTSADFRFGNLRPAP